MVYQEMDRRFFVPSVIMYFNARGSDCQFIMLYYTVSGCETAKSRETEQYLEAIRLHRRNVLEDADFVERYRASDFNEGFMESLPEPVPI
jgi:hypothetical protein